MHRRKSIRDAVVAGLSSAPEILALSPAPTVEASRWVPLDPAALPVILVYLRGERVDGYLTLAPREYKVLADLVVEYVSPNLATAKGEDALDAVALALEAAIDRLENDNLSDLVRNFEYRGTDVAISDAKVERPLVSLAMRYQLELGRVVGQLYTDDFITASVEHDVGDATADNPDDLVTLPIS